jgi:hypothetical protein
MKLNLLGPEKVFTCEFEVPEANKTPVVEAVANLRVLALNRREKQPGSDSWFERPLLIRAFGLVKKFTLADKSEKVGAKDCHVLVAPKSLEDADWFPMPDLYLQQARIEIKISESGAVGKLLQLKSDAQNGDRMLGSLPCKLDGGYLQAFLTNRGIEFKAGVPTPGTQGGATPATLLLNWNPKDLTRYQLELVSTGENQDIQESLIAGFRQLKTSPLELDYNATRAVAPLRWPLVVKSGKMQLEGVTVGATLGTWKTWKAYLDGSAVRCRMATAGDTLLAEVSPEVLNLEKTETAFLAEAQTGNPSANALAEWNLFEGKWIDKFVGAGLPEDVFIDAESIRSRVMPLYRAAGAYPLDNANPESDRVDPEYAFFFVDRGWLQCTLPKETPSTYIKHTQVLTGEIQVTLEKNTRWLQLEGAAGIAIKATWSLGAAGAPSLISLRVDKPEGNYSGFLYYAESSPTELDALPALQGGAIITRDASLRFGENAPHSVREWSGKLKNQVLDLVIPRDSYLWRRHARMPLIPNMPLTNGPAASGVPSSSRGLLPYKISPANATVSIQLDFKAAKLPKVTAPLAWPEFLTWPAATALLQLTAPSLPGVTIVPDKPETTYQAALRFDLPMLDEMFATATLPARKRPEGTPIPVAPASDGTSSRDKQRPNYYLGVIPTAVLPKLLETEIWKTHADLLKLAKVDMAQATKEFVPLDTVKNDSIIEGLVEPATWTTGFGVSSTPPLGSYKLNTLPYSGEDAAKGMNDTKFTLANNKLTAQDGPIEARNLAVHLFSPAEGFLQDSRGLIVAKAADAMAKNITFRAVRLRGNLAAKQRVATAKSPISVNGLWFWFRDLPFPDNSWKFDADNNPLESLTNAAESPGYDPMKIAESLHEWRLYQEPEKEKPAAFSIEIESFRFRPLRLRALELDANGTPTLLKVLGRLDLDEAVTWDKERPFGPDEAPRPGNLVDWEIISNTWTPYAGTQSFQFEKVLTCEGQEKIPDVDPIHTVEPSRIAVTLSYKLAANLSTAGDNVWTLEFLFAGAMLKMTGGLSDGKLLFSASVNAHRLQATVNLATQTLRIIPNFVLTTPGPQPSTVLALSSEGFQWLGLPVKKTATKWFLDIVTGRFWLNVPEYGVSDKILPGISLKDCRVSGSLQWLIVPGEQGAWNIPAIYGEFRSVPIEGSKTLRIVHTIKTELKAVKHDVRLTGELSRTSQIEWPAEVYPKQVGASLVVSIQREEYTWRHRFEVKLQDHLYPIDQLKAGALTGEWRFDAVVKHTLQIDGKEPVFTWRSLDQLRMLTGTTWIKQTNDFKNIQSFIGLNKGFMGSHMYRDEDVLNHMSENDRIRADWASSGFRDEWLAPELQTHGSQVFLLGGSLTVFAKEKSAEAGGVPDWRRYPLLWAYFADEPASFVLTQRDLDVPLEWRASPGDLPPLLDIQPQDAPSQTLPRQAREDEIKQIVEPALPPNTTSANLIPEWVQQVFFEPLEENTRRLSRRDDRPALAKSIPFFLGSLLAVNELRKMKPFPQAQWSLRIRRDKAAECVRIQVPQQPETELAPTTSEAPQLVVLSRKEGVKDGAISISDASNPTLARLTSLARTLVAEPLAIFLRTGGEKSALERIDPPRPLFDDHAAPGAAPNPLPKIIAPSPALGWPAEDGAEHSAKMVPTVGDEHVAVSEEVGVAARASATAWPAFGPPPEGPNYVEAIYYNSHAAVVFQPAPSDPPLSSPAPRHFSPVPNRVRAPLSKEVNEALKVLTGTSADHEKPKHVLPIGVPNLERGVTGLRPGAFHVFATSATIPGRVASFDPLVQRFGRPATRGPVIAHQLRAPRGTKLPVGADLSWRRRTFLSAANLNLLFGKFPGPAAVWRFDDQRWHFVLSVDPESPKVTPTWRGKLVLNIDSAHSADSQVGDLDKVLEDCHFKAAAAKLYIGTHSFSFRPLVIEVAEEADKRKVSMQLELLTDLTDALLAVTGNTPVYVEFQLPGTSATEPLQPGPPDFLRLPIQLAPPDRPVLPLSTTTIAFGDPSYDRQLASPAQLATRFSAQDNYVLSLDRRQYESNGSVYFAFGKIGTNGLFVDDPTQGDVTFKRVEVASGKTQDLTLGGIAFFPLKGAKAYSFNLAALLFDKQPVPWASGDQLLATVKISANLDLTATVAIVDDPQIAPPPSVYSLIRVKDTSAEVALHASGPMPQRIEFPEILRDLALGHVRRSALFVWDWTTTDPDGKLLLVKVDRSGGTQIPDPH